MTRGAWFMLLASWTVVVFFTARFFWRVLTLPPRAQDDPLEGEAEGRR